MPFILLALFAGCADASLDLAPCDGKIVEVSTYYTNDEDPDLAHVATCVEMTGPNDEVLDLSGCCPEGYDYLAMGTNGTTVLCEQTCGAGDDDDDEGGTT